MNFRQKLFGSSCLLLLSFHELEKRQDCVSFYFMRLSQMEHTQATYVFEVKFTVDRRSHHDEESKGNRKSNDCDHFENEVSK